MFFYWTVLVNQMRKNRLYEIAKRYGVPTKTARDFLSRSGYTVKNNMAILSENELRLLEDFCSRYRTNTEGNSRDSSEINPVILIEEWDDDAFYVAEIDPSLKLNGDLLREICSNDAEYYESYDMAVTAAHEMIAQRNVADGTSIVEVKRKDLVLSTPKQ